MIQTLPRTLAAAHPPAWKLLVAVAGCVALVYAATYITRLEERLPLIYYKRRLRVRPLALRFPSCFDKHSSVAAYQLQLQRRTVTCLKCHGGGGWVHSAGLHHPNGEGPATDLLQASPQRALIALCS